MVSDIVKPYNIRLLAYFIQGTFIEHKLCREYKQGTLARSWLTDLSDGLLKHFDVLYFSGRVLQNTLSLA